MTTGASLLQLNDIYERDINFVIDNINNEPSDFWRRSLIRLCTSLFESEIFLLKTQLIKHCAENSISLKPELRLALEGKKHTVESNGKLKSSYLSIKLTDDIRFTFQTYMEIRNFQLISNYSDNGWNDLKETIKIRNRITHPKSISEQEITTPEVYICMSGYNWFHKNYDSFMKQELEYLQSKKYELENKISTLLNRP